LFRERGVRAITQAHVSKIDPGLIHYEQVDGTTTTLPFDFAMLLPPFRGADLKALDATGEDITATMFAPSGFMKVDADYTPKPYADWRAADWPSTYQTPAYANVFGVGIAFAPPHQISQPRTSPNGTVIAPAPPRTGMPSGIMGRTVARTIADRIKGGAGAPAHTASMAAMGAACVASAGTGLRRGTAAAMTMYPVVPDGAPRTPTARSAWPATGSRRSCTTCSSIRPKRDPGGSSSPSRDAHLAIRPTADKRTHGQRRRRNRPGAAPHAQDRPLQDQPARAGLALRRDQPAHGQDHPKGSQLVIHRQEHS